MPPAAAFVTGMTFLPNMGILSEESQHMLIVTHLQINTGRREEASFPQSDSFLKTKKP
jgi:hypothetical protein